VSARTLGRHATADHHGQDMAVRPEQVEAHYPIFFTFLEGKCLCFLLGYWKDSGGTDSRARRGYFTKKSSLGVSARYGGTDSRVV
jgi:hypothetical protein